MREKKKMKKKKWDDGATHRSFETLWDHKKNPNMINP